MPCTTTDSIPAATSSLSSIAVATTAIVLAALRWFELLSIWDNRCRSLGLEYVRMNALNGGRPERVAIIGAGMVGLCTAWYLQERSVDVTVFDSDGVAAGSSWGNAGWLTPASRHHCRSRPS